VKYFTAGFISGHALIFFSSLSSVFLGAKSAGALSSSQTSVLL
jgi:hypothetical protein